MADPYPNALPLPAMPAHPRCRCTVRAVYRDPDGNVISQAAQPVEPKLPPDAMGGKSPPIVPPAVGDINRPATRRTLATDDFMPDYRAHRQFWRTADISKLDVSKLTKGEYEGLLMKRYGISTFYGPKTPFKSIEAKYRTNLINALESYAGVGHRWDQSFALRQIEFRQTLPGFPNPAQYLPQSSRVQIALQKYREIPFGQPYRIGHRDYYESSMIHELGHALDAHRRGPLAASLLSRSEADEFRALHLATKSTGLFDIDRQLADAKRNRAASIDQIDYFKSISTGVDPLYGTDPYASRIETHVELVKRYDAVIDTLTKLREDAAKLAGKGPALTDYAKTNELEDFADSAVAWILDRERLSNTSPGRYELMERYFGGGQ